MRNSQRSITHAGLLDDLRNLDKELLVLFRVFAPDKNLYGKLVALDLVEILGYCLWSDLERLLVCVMSRGESAPFFCVVRIYSVSGVKSISVVGNS